MIGGFVGSTSLPTDRVRVLDLATRTWLQGPPLPAPVGGAAAVVLGGRIHVLGGGNDISTVATHLVLAPATGRWTTAAPLPRAGASHSALGSRVVEWFVPA